MGTILAGAAVCAFVGLIIGATKGKAGAGFLLGGILGPIGWIIAAVMQPTPQLAAQRQAQIDAARERLANGGPAQQQRSTWD